MWLSHKEIYMIDLNELLKEALKEMDCESFLKENLTDEQKKKLEKIRQEHKYITEN
jgi:5-methylcytosine-specific restriction endonuclease McrBC GTP-binding regulatory subunit McrB